MHLKAEMSPELFVLELVTRRGGIVKYAEASFIISK